MLFCLIAVKLVKLQYEEKNENNELLYNNF